MLQLDNNFQIKGAKVRLSFCPPLRLYRLGLAGKEGEIIKKAPCVTEYRPVHEVMFQGHATPLTVHERDLHFLNKPKPNYNEYGRLLPSKEGTA